jgi:hypothetical protein
MAGLVEVVATGIVWENPDPDARSLHAWHPTLADLGGGRWLCSFDVASAVLAPDYGTWLASSDDDGATWSEPWPMAAGWGDPGATTHSLRITRLRDGSFVAAGARWLRDGRYARGLNRETSGWCPMELVLSRSHDGRAWSRPTVITPPLDGPTFEVCHRIVILPDGRWLWPTSTWRGWDGDEGSGMRAVALVSHDDGATWPEHLEVLDGRPDGVAHWEQSLVPLPDGRLLAVSWAFRPADSRTLELPWALASDERSFAARGSTGLRGQTTKLAPLGDGRVLAVYRRDDEPGLWAAVARIERDAWVTVGGALLWDGAASGMRGHGSVADDLSRLAFGAPNLMPASDGTVLVAFWRRERCQYGIGWLRLRVADRERP